MKRYKAVFLDGRKLIKSAIIVIITGIFVILSFTISKNFSYTNAISDSLPIIGVANNELSIKKDRVKQSFYRVIELISGMSPDFSTSFIKSELPISYAVNQRKVVVLSTKNNPQPRDSSTNINTQNYEILPENRGPIKDMNLSPNKDGQNKVVIGNETSFSINIDEMLSSSLNIKINKDNPTVLIIHTHATESYAINDQYYDKTQGDRSLDTSKNVVKAGEVICEILNKKGIKTIHDKTLHDHPSYNGSYANSLNSIEKYLKEYPSIQVVFDIHRDSIIYKDGTKARPVTEINGKRAAQLMFVVGTNENGLEHPNWQENIKTAIHFQNIINKRYPTLMRHINLRKDRFNGHTTNGSMIIETGSGGNSLDEAIYGLSLAADCIGDYLLNFK